MSPDVRVRDRGRVLDFYRDLGESPTASMFGDRGIEHGRGCEVSGSPIRIGRALNDRGPLIRLCLDTAGCVAGGTLGVADLAGEAFFPQSCVVDGRFEGFAIASLRGRQLLGECGVFAACGLVLRGDAT
jgi:hypothetical protein